MKNIYAVCLDSSTTDSDNLWDIIENAVDRCMVVFYHSLDEAKNYASSVLVTDEYETACIIPLAINTDEVALDCSLSVVFK